MAVKNVMYVSNYNQINIQIELKLNNYARNIKMHKVRLLLLLGMMTIVCIMSYADDQFAYEKKTTWAGTMIGAKQSLTVATETGTIDSSQLVSALFSIKNDYPREHNYFFHHYWGGANWFTPQGNDELKNKIIPAMLSELAEDSDLHNEYKQIGTELEILNFFLKSAKNRSLIKTITPETKTRTPEEADEMLIEDWLYQVDGLPYSEDCQNELNWARKIIERIMKTDQKIDLNNELAELAKLESVLKETIKDNPDALSKDDVAKLTELLAASIHGSLDVDIAVDNGTYTLQLLVHEGWLQDDRIADIFVEGKLVKKDYDYWNEQGKTFDHASVVRYTFALSDGNIDIEFKDYKDGSHLGGLILSKGNGETVASHAIVKSTGDLDLKDVVKAINFGTTRNLKIGSTEFVAASANSTVNGVTNKATGEVYAGQYGQRIPNPKFDLNPENSPFSNVYIAIRRIKRQVIFKDPVIDFDELLFVDNPFPMRWTAGSSYNVRFPGSPFTYYNEWNHQSHHRNGFNALSGGRLLTLKGLNPGGEIRELAPGNTLGDGAVLRPDISFDGKKLLFSFKAEDEQNYHIYEMNIDGSGVKQLTFGNYDDNDPIYLQDGHIMFTTTRGNTYVRCQHYSASTILARCDGDGKNIYLISQNSEPDWLPSRLSDGRVVYTRWEYSDKNVMRVQGLWTTNIDGTGTEVLWGNQSVWPDNLASPRQIPGTNKVMFSGVGHHGWFNGSIGIIDPSKGREYPDGLIKVTQDVQFAEVGDGPTKLDTASDDYHAAGQFYSYKNPYPLSEKLFLVSAFRGPSNKDMQMHHFNNTNGRHFADRFRLYLMDIDGNKELIYGGEHQILHAVPLKTSERTHVKPSAVKWPGTGKDRKTLQPGIFYSNDVYEGTSIPKGIAKYVRIIEMDYRTHSTWYSGYYMSGAIPTPQVSATFLDSLKIILGTVPVEDDGSYSFEAPAGKQLFFELLDEDYRCIQIMRSFVGLMPGERRGCVGCHERQTTAQPMETYKVKAQMREPSRISPPPWGVKSISYKKMIQPIFEKNCNDCHMGDGEAREKLDLTQRPSSHYYDRFSDPYLTLIGSSSYATGFWIFANLRGSWDKPLENYAGGFDVSRGAASWSEDGPTRTIEAMTALSYTSPLINLLIDGKHHDVELSNTELRTLIAWIDCNTPYRDDAELRETDDPIFDKIEVIPIRPEMKNAPRIERP